MTSSGLWLHDHFSPVLSSALAFFFSNGQACVIAVGTPGNGWQKEPGKTAAVVPGSGCSLTHSASETCSQTYSVLYPDNWGFHSSATSPPASIQGESGVLPVLPSLPSWTWMYFNYKVETTRKEILEICSGGRGEELERKREKGEKKKLHTKQVCLGWLLAHRAGEQSNDGTVPLTKSMSVTKSIIHLL